VGGVDYKTMAVGSGSGCQWHKAINSLVDFGGVPEYVWGEREGVLSPRDK
jgi:hypothetical protein